MPQTTFALLNTREEAQTAIDALQVRGFNPKEISIITKETETVSDATGSGIASGTVGGATTGGVIGALAGLLVGIGAIAVPGIGALLIGGPVAAALGLTGAAASTVSGAVTGALAGGLIGALTKLGIPEPDARIYEQRISTGAVLIAVPSRDLDSSEIETILQDHGATNIRTIALNP